VRKITKREQKLLFIFLGAIFLLFNLIGVAALFRKQAEFQSKLKALRIERLDARSWLAEKDTWQKRREWLDKTQPKLKTAGEADGALLDALQSSAGKYAITITDKSFGDPVQQPYYQEIAVKLKVNGSLEAVIRWLDELQQPANFQAIPSLSMKTDNDPTKISCELTVARWFAVK